MLTRTKDRMIFSGKMCVVVPHQSFCRDEQRHSLPLYGLLSTLSLSPTDIPIIVRMFASPIPPSPSPNVHIPDVTIVIVKECVLYFCCLSVLRVNFVWCALVLGLECLVCVWTACLVHGRRCIGSVWCVL